ncbi:MAG TPA: flagellar brake protein [Gammaproteobacteria bacterium]|nr:flagellar brake protein [Gammaproteobacteria bacterium]
MSELALDIGDILQLQFLGDDSEARYYVKVIGYLEERSLLVTAPQSNGKLLRVRDGQPLAARMMAGTDLVGFTVSVLRSCAVPYPYLHLSYPKDLQSVTVRKSLRVALDMGATVRPCDIGSEDIAPEVEAHEVVIRDMSTTGALLVADAPLADTGDSLTVSVNIEVAEMVENLNFAVVVRNIKVEPAQERGRPSQFLHGVEFQFADRRESVLLHAFVYEQIVRNHD